MTATLPAALVLFLTLAVPGTASASPEPSPLRRAIAVEVARLTEAEAARARQATPPPRRNWVQRHPVATTAIAAGLSGFAIGWSMGDDGLFDDFTGEFNGIVLGGICAGIGSATVAVIRAAGRAASPAP